MKLPQKFSPEDFSNNTEEQQKGHHVKNRIDNITQKKWLFPLVMSFSSLGFSFRCTFFFFSGISPKAEAAGRKISQCSVTYHEVSWNRRGWREILCCSSPTTTRQHFIFKFQLTGVGNTKIWKFSPISEHIFLLHAFLPAVLLPPAHHYPHLHHYSNFQCQLYYHAMPGSLLTPPPVLWQSQLCSSLLLTSLSPFWVNDLTNTIM